MTQELDAAPDAELLADTVFGTLRTADVPPRLVAMARRMLAAERALVVVRDGKGWNTAIVDTEPSAAPLDPSRLHLETSRVADVLTPRLDRLRPEGCPLLAYPLVTRNRLHGVFWALRTRGHPVFTDAHISQISVVAALLSLALDNTQLEHDVVAAHRASARRAVPLAYAEHHLRAAREASTDPVVSEHVQFALDGIRRLTVP